MNHPCPTQLQALLACPTFCRFALVEGETELGTLPLWGDLANHDIALYSVGGKGEFARVVRLLHQFAIPWVILCDADALWDRKQKGKHSGDLHVKAVLQACGQTAPTAKGDPGGSADVFLAWRRTLEPFGIFTLAQSSDQAFEKAIAAEIPEELWKSARQHCGDNKVAVGRYIAEHHECPASVRAALRRMLEHLRDRGSSIRVPERLDG